MECFNPKWGWQAGLDEKGTNNVVSGSEKALGFTILWRGVWAGKAIDNAICGEEGTKGGVEEFVAVIALLSFDDDVVLGFDVREEALEHGGRVGFVT